MIIDHDTEGKITHVAGLVYQMILWLAEKYDFTQVLLILKEYLL